MILGSQSNFYLRRSDVYFVLFMASYQVANGLSEGYCGQAVTKFFTELRSGIPRFIAEREEITNNNSVYIQPSVSGDAS